MPFVIDATDKPEAEALRASTRAEHLAYLEANVSRLLAAGAKLRDDGTTAWGSVYLLDTDERAEAEAFIAGDPFSTAGVFAEVAITRWRKAFFDRRKG
jgi:uncharacterized protein YciI